MTRITGTITIDDMIRLEVDKWCERCEEPIRNSIWCIGAIQDKVDRIDDWINLPASQKTEETFAAKFCSVKVSSDTYIL